MNPIFSSLPTTIFEEMSARARARGAINLGQGFPDEDGPEDIRAVAADALMRRSNQYPPMTGLPELREAVAAHYAHFQGIKATAEDVLITSGATEALAATLFALISPGDEVVLLQPMYDAYLPLVLRAGGVPRFLRLRPPDWALTAEDIAAAIGPKTRLVIFNNPLNPAARVFTWKELALLAAACVRHGVVAISDEVWEHVVFDERRHVSLLELPRMRDRTVKIGSAGKIFSMTGWKVGFVLAAPPLLSAIKRAHQFLTFTTPPALQVAVAYGLGKEDSYFKEMRRGYQRSRDRLADALTAGGFVLSPSEGSYFLCVDLAASGIPAHDRDVSIRLVEEWGVAAIPVSAFYAEHPVTSVIRLCFAKDDATLDEAARRLNAARTALSSMPPRPRLP